MRWDRITSTLLPDAGNSSQTRPSNIRPAAFFPTRLPLRVVGSPLFERTQFRILRIDPLYRAPIPATCAEPLDRSKCRKYKCPQVWTAGAGDVAV